MDADALDAAQDSAEDRGPIRRTPRMRLTPPRRWTSMTCRTPRTRPTPTRPPLTRSMLRTLRMRRLMRALPTRRTRHPMRPPMLARRGPVRACVRRRSRSVGDAYSFRPARPTKNRRCLERPSAHSRRRSTWPKRARGDGGGAALAVSSGEFDEHVRLRNGVSVHGGLTRPTWSRSGTTTVTAVRSRAGSSRSCLPIPSPLTPWLTG